MMIHKINNRNKRNQLTKFNLRKSNRLLTIKLMTQVINNHSQMRIMLNKMIKTALNTMRSIMMKMMMPM